MIVQVTLLQDALCPLSSFQLAILQVSFLDHQCFFVFYVDRQFGICDNIVCPLTDMSILSSER